LRDHAIEPAEPVTEPIPASEPPRGGQRTGRRDVVSRYLAFVLVLLVAAVGVARLVEYHWRQGSALIACALLLAALWRALLPDRTAGLLVVRSRPVDVLSYAALGGLMLFMALTLTGGPFG
jgi:hypothetical protein